MKPAPVPLCATYSNQIMKIKFDFFCIPYKCLAEQENWEEEVKKELVVLIASFWLFNEMGVFASIFRESF